MSWDKPPHPIFHGVPNTSGKQKSTIIQNKQANVKVATLILDTVKGETNHSINYEDEANTIKQGTVTSLLKTQAVWCKTRKHLEYAK